MIDYRGATCDKSNWPGDLCRETENLTDHVTEDGRIYHFCEGHTDPETRKPDPGIWTARNDPRGR